MIGDGGPSFPEGGPAPSCRLEAPFAGSPSGTLSVGEREDGSFVSYDDDLTSRFSWGLQGGTMILPVIGVPIAAAGDERCFDVTLRHLPDPAAPDAFGDVGSFGQTHIQTLGEADADTVWLDPIMDQIGWDELDGTRLLLEVTVRGGSFASTHTVAIEILSNTPAVCLALVRDPAGSGSCGYRHIPGSAIVTSIAPHMPASGEASCPEGRVVMVRFEPDDPEAVVCYEAFSGTEPVTQNLQVGPYSLPPPAACLTGVDVGSTFPATLDVAASGTCLPLILNVELSGCEAACPS